MVMNKTKVALLSLSLLLAAPVYTEGNTTEQNISSQAIENKEEGKNSSEKLNEFIEKEKQQDKKSEEKNDSVEAKKTYYQRVVAVLASAGTMMKNSPGYVWGKTKALYNVIAGYVKGTYNWVTGVPTAEQLTSAKALASNPVQLKKTFNVATDKSIQEIIELLGKTTLTEEENAKLAKLLEDGKVGAFKKSANVVARLVTFGKWSPFESNEKRAVFALATVKLEATNLQEAIAADKAVNENSKKAALKKSLEAKVGNAVDTVARYLNSLEKPTENKKISDVVKA